MPLVAAILNDHPGVAVVFLARIRWALVPIVVVDVVQVIGLITLPKPKDGDATEAASASTISTVRLPVGEVTNSG